MTYHKLGI